MKKLKLYAIGNENKFNYYIFDKDQKVMNKLTKLFSIFNLSWDFYREHENKKGQWVTKKIYIKNFRDFHESINCVGNKNRIDIFYGDKKIFLTINCSLKLKLKFNCELEKLFIMPKPNKFKPFVK